MNPSSINQSPPPFLPFPLPRPVLYCSFVPPLFSPPIYIEFLAKKSGAGCLVEPRRVREHRIELEAQLRVLQRERGAVRLEKLPVPRELLVPGAASTQGGKRRGTGRAVLHKLIKLLTPCSCGAGIHRGTGGGSSHLTALRVRQHQLGRHVPQTLMPLPSLRARARPAA